MLYINKNLIVNENYISYVKLNETPNGYSLDIVVSTGQVFKNAIRSKRKDILKNKIRKCFKVLTQLTDEYFVNLNNVVYIVPHYVNDKVRAYTIFFNQHQLSIAKDWLISDIKNLLPELCKMIEKTSKK